MKLNFSGLNLEQAMRMVPTKKLLPWEIDAPLREPSTVLPVVIPSRHSPDESLCYVLLRGSKSAAD